MEGLYTKPPPVLIQYFCPGVSWPKQINVPLDISLFAAFSYPALPSRFESPGHEQVVATCLLPCLYDLSTLQKDLDGSTEL